MNGIKYYALDENEEVPYEFVVIRNVDGEPEFCASFVNTNSLAYGNGALLKLHERNDELRADNAKLRELVRLIMHQCNDGNPRCDECIGWNDGECAALLRMRELGVEVD